MPNTPRANLSEILEPKSLPDTAPLKGAICAQYVRCGNPRCRCRRGELHGPYHYRLWREGGRVRKAYVKPSELESVRAACAAYQENRRSSYRETV
jgi:hypothetical protein